MLYDFVVFENLVEDLEGTAAIDHEILRDDLKPVAGGLASEDMVVVRDAQADADAVGGEVVEAICRHDHLEKRKQKLTDRKLRTDL